MPDKVGKTFGAVKENQLLLGRTPSPSICSKLPKTFQANRFCGRENYTANARVDKLMLTLIPTILLRASRDKAIDSNYSKATFRGLISK
jgi:hypothetical protein